MATDQRVMPSLPHVSCTYTSDGGWNIPEDDPRRKAWIESNSNVKEVYLPVNWGWPSIERGVEVSIEVCSDLNDSEEERPACRSLILIVAFQSLTYLASYVTAPSVLPAEVAHPLVPVRMLTRSSLPSSMLPAAVSEALGIDLDSVLCLYFRELDDMRRGRLIGEAIDRRRTIEEGEEWLAEEGRRRDIIAERAHRGREDESF
jgi:hypothetical protein